MTWREVTDEHGTSVVLDDTWGNDRISIQGRNIHPTNNNKVFIGVGNLDKDGNPKGADDAEDYNLFIFDRKEFVDAVKQEFGLSSWADILFGTK